MSGVPDAPSLVNAAPRVGTATPPRVVISHLGGWPPRQTGSPRHRMPIIHQRETHNNYPFQILADNDDDNGGDDMVVHSNCSPRAPLPNLLEPHLPTAISTPFPGPLLHRPEVFLKLSPPLIPLPTVGLPKDTPAVTIHDIRPGHRKWARPISMTAPPWYTVIKLDVDHPDQPTAHVPTPPRRSTRIIRPRMPGNISPQAMHHVMTLEAIKVATNSQWTRPIIDIKECCFGDMHLITKETITQYKIYNMI
jgi:hypothetical protein